MTVLETPTAADAATCCGLATTPVTEDDATRLAGMFKALGDPVRLRMASMIASAPEVCVCEITPAFDLSSGTISHHLKTLREAGLVDCERRELMLSTEGIEDDMVRVCVADTGTGLAEEVAAKLFQPFITTKRYGMGVGLSISRTIIQAHGGQIWADPNPGGGTIFRFSLPSGRIAETAGGE